jgi:alkylhydroperoxidase family enzyme
MSHVTLLGDADAWARLPEADGAKAGPLPTWARALAGALPRTTAATLEVDYVQRARSPLDPKLRAQVRWAAARANRSPYGEAYALADLRRAGAGEAEVKALEGDWKKLPDSRRLALEFARNLTLHAYRVTDEDVAALRAHYGDADTVALVQCVAYANFQDRLVLSLELAVEEGGPLPPVAVRFRKPYQGGSVARPESSKGVSCDTSPRTPFASVLRACHSSMDYAALRAATQAQKERTARIPVPPVDDVRKRLPAGFTADWVLRINWSRVCLGYQPELALAWTNAPRTFEAEARLDPVFEESLFLVVTSAQQCFY